jgi:hypothetical protein
VEFILLAEELVSVVSVEVEVEEDVEEEVDRVLSAAEAVTEAGDRRLLRAGVLRVGLNFTLESKDLLYAVTADSTVSVSRRSFV